MNRSGKRDRRPVAETQFLRDLCTRSASTGTTLNQDRARDIQSRTTRARKATTVPQPWLLELRLAVEAMKQVCVVKQDETVKRAAVRDDDHRLGECQARDAL
jgi:hypothetical protein